MSGFSGINLFGNLTVNGKKLTFKDFDKDNNGQISQEEYNSVLKDMQLSTVELSTVDKNSDNIISQDEFLLWEQKIQIQDAVNALSKTISKDFAGKTELLTQLTEALKDCINEFVSTYNKDFSDMAEAFKEVLPEKYNSIKTTLLANDSSTIKSKVLDDIYTQLTIKENLPEATANRIVKELGTEADKFIKTYKGTRLENDLTAHLETYMNTSDANKLKDAAEEFKTNANSFSSNDDNGLSLTQLKEYAKEFLQVALDAGVTIKLAGTTIMTESAIITVLKKFSDGDELKVAIEDIINNLSTDTFKERLIIEEKAKAIEAENKKFTDIKGDSYTVNSTLIDYSGVEGYSEGSDCIIKEKAENIELSSKLREEMSKRLESIKSQMKEQIKAMLDAKGVPFEKVEQIFENVYYLSFNQAFNTEGMVSIKHKTWFHRGNATTNVKQFVDQFINNFNDNIAVAIDEINASDNDFDVIDIDMSSLGKDENGNTIETENNDDILKAYQTGIPLITKGKGADYYVTIAEQIIDGLKTQILAKAKNMCKANGIEFNMDKFNTIFNNAKELSVNAAVNGCDKKGRNWKGTGASVASGAVAGVGALGAATTTAITGYVVAGSIEIAGTTASVMAPIIGAVTGPVGWIVGGALLVGGILTAVFGFGGDKSQSLLNTRTLIDGFTSQFSASFSQWVDEEKVEIKNKK